MLKEYVYVRKYWFGNHRLKKRSRFVCLQIGPSKLGGCPFAPPANNKKQGCHQKGHPHICMLKNTCMLSQVASGLGWWFGFAIEPLVLVGKWETTLKHQTANPNHQLVGTFKKQTGLSLKMGGRSNFGPFKTSPQMRTIKEKTHHPKHTCMGNWPFGQAVAGNLAC